MIRIDTTFRDRVTAAVRRIESSSTAEIVVVVAARSGSYRDLAAIVGAVAGWITLAFLLYSPIPFRPGWLPVEVAAIGCAASWIAHRSPWLLRALAGSARVRRQVRSAARSAFLEESVQGTRGHTGVLVYLSRLEGCVVLLPDAGLLARIPGADWNGVSWGSSGDPRRVDGLDSFVKGLEAVGRLVAHAAPGAGGGTNEMSDAPRIRP